MTMSSRKPGRRLLFKSPTAGAETRTLPWQVPFLMQTVVHFSKVGKAGTVDQVAKKTAECC